MIFQEVEELKNSIYKEEVVSGATSKGNCRTVSCFNICTKLLFNVPGFWIILEIGKANENIRRYKIFAMAKEVGLYNKVVFKEEYSEGCGTQNSDR
jgi:hypothetical protein